MRSYAMRKATMKPVGSTVDGREDGKERMEAIKAVMRLSGK
jgi:hypothetical protein